ncbi:enoyl-CoA hydratase [Gammaproteobacteria bacterium]|nr:enoyl-CoA hydratase [Gammaproteobacteria bacterium]
MNTDNSLVSKEKLESGLLRLTLNNPQSKNALSEDMISALMNSINAAFNDHSIKVIIIGASGNVFCAGHDLKEITEARETEDSGDRYYKDLFDSCSSLMQLIVNCPKPIIAEVDGVATAAGCQLVASCDLAIASDVSKFATPGVNIGLFCSTPMVALSRNVHKKNAMEMLLTGDMIDCKKAKEIGLINDYISSNDLSASVVNLAEKIANKSAKTVATGKKAFYEQAEMSLADAYKYTSEVMKENLLRSDAKEGINAFLEKRTPRWDDE